ncbi:penicillin-binding transpeptidase domain-containing protein, partial [Escherichia coli]|uniref:penicillin-binding transpeptidase domain-containing protein n=1 Tax=Escherichia coli TaxID=562 RepID=UPI001BC87DBD
MALNPATSEVLAWVGSRDFTQDAYDHVQQARRQPGSTFKPFVYGAALQQGATPDDKRVQAGFVALNPATSEVLAWVGSRDFTQDAYDHV